MLKKELLEKINKMPKDDICISDLKNILYFEAEKNKSYKELIVYYLLDKNNKVLYIGRSVDLKNRIRNHITNPNIIHNEEWKKLVKKVKYFNLKSFDDMMLYEKCMIGKYKPLYNKDLINSELILEELKEFKVNKIEFFLKCINVKESAIVDRLKIYIEECSPERIILVDWIRENFYDEKTNQETVNSMYKNSKDEILKRIKGYTLISKRGRGFRAYLKKV